LCSKNSTSDVENVGCEAEKSCSVHEVQDDTDSSNDETEDVTDDVTNAKATWYDFCVQATQFVALHVHAILHREAMKKFHAIQRKICARATK